MLEAANQAPRSIPAFKSGYWRRPAFRQSHGVKVVAHDGDTIHFAGSGVFDFADMTGIGPGAQPASTETDFLFKWLARTFSVVLREVWNQDSLHFLYGGWFEFVVNDGQRFLKVPYLIKFWSVRNGEVDRSLPAVQSWYREHHMMIAQISGRGIQVCVVEDPLRRMPLNADDLWRPSQEPIFHAHIVHCFDTAKSFVLLHSQGMRKFHLAIRADGSGFDERLEPGLIEEILSAVGGGRSHYMIHRDYD